MLVSKYAGLDEFGWQELEAKHSPEVIRMLSRFVLELQPDQPHVVSRLPQGYPAPFFSAGVEATRFRRRHDVFPESYIGALLVHLGCPTCGQGVFTDREITLGGLLLPHLRRSVTISGLLDACTVEKARMAETLDAFKCGVVLTNRSGSILHANRVGRADDAPRGPDPGR